MRSRLAISAVVAAALFGATAIASAQTEPAKPAPAASGEGNVGTGSATPAKSIKSNHRIKSSHLHMKPGTTTGMSTRSFTEKSKPGGQSTARKAPSS